MVKRHDRSFARAETEIAGAIAAAGSDRQAAAAAVAEVLARDLAQAGRTGTGLLSAVSALADGAARAAAGGEAECVAEGFMIGVMLATERGRDSLLAVIAHAAGTFVKHACAAGADAGAAARGLVEGAAAWADERGLAPAEAADAAGQGAADAAEEVGPAAGREVRDALTSGLIAGVAVMLKEPAALRPGAG